MERLSTYSEAVPSGYPGHILAGVCILLCVFSFSSCGEESGEPQASGTGAAGADRLAQELEYRLIKGELSLAKEKIPYLVLDMEKKEIAVRLAGVTVWGYPMRFATEDTLDVREFIRRFHGREGKLLRPVTDKHLFEATDQTPDSVLDIVGKALKIDPGLMQREVPERFRLLWGDDVVLEVRTGAQGRPISKLRNALVEIGTMFHRPLGLAMVVLEMEPRAALTLYRMSTPGLPTLINPPKRSMAGGS